MRMAALESICALWGSAFSRDALALSEGDVGAPLCALARRGDVVVHLIDLLKGQALGLIDEEVYEGNAEEASGEPDEEDLALKVGIPGTVVDEVRGRVGDGPVEKPLQNFTALIRSCKC